MVIIYCVSSNGINNDNTVYAQLGVLASLSMLAGIVAAKIFGTIVDVAISKNC